jgi:hypothetical protein
MPQDIRKRLLNLAEHSRLSLDGKTLELGGQVERNGNPAPFLKPRAYQRRLGKKPRLFDHWWMEHV